MIIDIRSHFKKIKKESELFSRKEEIETQLKNALSYFDFMLMRQVSPKKTK